MALTPAANAASLVSDTRSLDRLKAQAGKDPRAAIADAAKQFEAVFMQAVVKSMRDTLPKGGIDGGSAGEHYTAMYDQQLAQAMSGRPGGLGDAIARQLMGRINGAHSSGSPRPDLSVGASPKLTPTQTEFVEKLWKPAVAAQRETGIPAAFIVGQAALETGWGKSEIRRPDGSSANNLFGIKAGASWQGQSVEARTTEYEGGQPVRVVERFRAYADYAESMRDWAQLMVRSPRYSAAVRGGQTVEGFAQGLQKGGYATDPEYAAKLSKVINQTLGLKRTLSAADIVSSAPVHGLVKQN